MGESNRSGRKNAFRKETASHDEPIGIHRRRSGGGAHPLPGGQSHGGQRGGLRRRGAAGHPAGLGAAGHPAPAPVFPHVAHPDPHQRVQGNSPPTGAAGPL